MLEIISKHPKECDCDELAKFSEKACKVSKNISLTLVKRAYLLVFVYKRETDLVGIGAIKKPNEKYKDRVFLKADLSELSPIYRHELGWMFVEKQMRGQGLGSKIIQQLVPSMQGKKIFAIVREDNDPMKQLLKINKFTQVGKEYPSEKGDYKLTVFLRN